VVLLEVRGHSERLVELSRGLDHLSFAEPWVREAMEKP
jgi:hypothetical protein